MSISPETLRWIFERLVLIRTFEERVRTEFANGRIPGFVHLYAGEEAVAVGVCANLTERDYITSTHRGHGHCIVKGCAVSGMMAELFGKATGLCKGKGGSMHIADFDRGMLGANGVVAGSAPLSCGSALSAKLQGTDQVTVCFFGDGGANQGSVHESLNLAAIWSLPLVFVLENNLYAESTPASYHSSVENIAERAVAYDIPGVVVDGMNVFDVYEAAQAAVARARAGGGPSLLECKTYRFYGHYEGDAQTYRSPEEVTQFREERDPIKLFRERVLERSLLEAAEMDAIAEKAALQVEEAVKFAEDSPYPDLSETFSDVYANY